MSESNAPQSGQKFGNERFVLVRPLGRGGMGEVWLAQDERLQVAVALKFVPSEIRGDAAALDWLRRETVRSHQLSHPNIVRIHDLHEDADGTLFIVMEYVDGPTLAALQVEQPRRVFHWDFLRPLLEQLCAALDYAHRENVIHRDLKPANLMVNAKGRLKLADFGLAAVISDAGTRGSAQRSTSGTLPYMSPQQVAGKRPEAANDIYALGITLYELLTSQTPFYTGELTHQILNEPPEPIRDRLAALGIENEIPPDVAALIMACLAKDPSQRPQSAAAVAEWIGLEIERKPVLSSLGGHVSADESQASPVPDLPPTLLKKMVWFTIPFAAALLLAAAVWFGAQKIKAWKLERPKTPPIVEMSTSNNLVTTPAIEWISLFNGLTLSGWKALDPGDWSVEEDGSIFSEGPRSHLFSPHVYTNLEFRAEIKLSPGANGGMFFRAAAHPGKVKGYEAQAANSDPMCKTGGLFGFDNLTSSLVEDDVWFTEHVVAIGNRVIIKVNDQIVVDYVDSNYTHRSGHLALQHQSIGKAVRYRHVVIKSLPDDEETAWAVAKKDMTDISP